MEQIALISYITTKRKILLKVKRNTSYSQGGVNPYKLSQVRKNKVKVQTKNQKRKWKDAFFFIILLISTMNVFGQDKNIYNDGVIYNETGIAMNFLAVLMSHRQNYFWSEQKERDHTASEENFRIYSDNFDLFSV